MQVEFELTFEDYREAQEPPAVGTESTWRSALLTIAIVAATSFGYWVAKRYLVTDPPMTWFDPILSEIAVPLFPWVIILGWSLFLIVKPKLSVPPDPWAKQAAIASNSESKRALPVARQIMGVHLLIAILIVVFAASQLAMDPNTGRLQPSARVANAWMVPLIFWIAYGWWMAFVAVRTARQNVLMSWTRQEQLRRPMKVEFSAQGASFTGILSHAQCQWGYFAGCREIPNLFVLYASPMLFHIVPKRAIPSPDELNQLRELLDVNITRRGRPNL